jgi:hypothetical protein
MARGFSYSAWGSLNGAMPRKRSSSSRMIFKFAGGKAIDKVMKNNPAIFLKLLVLLVPREMKVEHTGRRRQGDDRRAARTGYRGHHRHARSP